jgi:hypothetical protein
VGPPVCCVDRFFLNPGEIDSYEPPGSCLERRRVIIGTGRDALSGPRVVVFAQVGTLDAIAAGMSEKPVVYAP